MSRENFVLKNLLEKGEVTWKPSGHSMSGRINSGDQVILKSIANISLYVGDIVYVKVKGNYYLHLITSIDYLNKRYQISNNHGYVNGWVSINNIYGICIRVNDKVLLTDIEINNRLSS